MVPHNLAKLPCLYIVYFWLKKRLYRHRRRNSWYRHFLIFAWSKRGEHGGTSYLCHPRLFISLEDFKDWRLFKSSNVLLLEERKVCCTWVGMCRSTRIAAAALSHLHEYEKILNIVFLYYLKCFWQQKLSQRLGHQVNIFFESI